MIQKVNVIIFQIKGDNWFILNILYIKYGLIFSPMKQKKKQKNRIVAMINEFY